MLGIIAEAAGHAAAGGFDQFRLGARDQPQHIQDGGNGAKGLLVAMAVQQDGLCRRPEAPAGSALPWLRGR